MSTRQAVIEIDLTTVGTPTDLQELLARALEFPPWYGRNWDAFWDAITGLVEMPRRLRLVGWAEFATRLPEDAKLLQRCLNEMAAQYPESSTEVEYLS
jgi:RNAse (barnase) inhibitor barstar